MSNKRIDLTQFEGVMNVDWLFDEQLIVGKGEWRFALNEYSDLADMSAKDIEEWEEGLEPVWDSLTNGVAMLPGLIAELKRCYDEIDDLRARLMLAPYEEGDGYSVTCEACDKDWMIQDAKLLARFIKEGKIVREFEHLESPDCPSCVTAAHE